MEDSILISTKKILGLAADYTAFDLDVITHINAAFSTLHQLGVGPETGLAIEDETTTWSDFFEDNGAPFNAVKTYIYLRARLLFDPPTTSYAQEALQRQVQELEWRLNVMREDIYWVNPNPPPVPIEEVW
jgi:hypothetical protein